MLIACTYVPHNYRHEVKDYSFPVPYAQRTAYLGEELLVQGRRQEGRALRIESPMGGFCYQIHSGTYDMIGVDGEKYFFEARYIERDNACDPHQALMIDTSKPDEVCVVSTYNTEYCYKGTIKVIDYTDPLYGDLLEKPIHFQRTLYLSNIKGNEVELMYTEKSGLQTVMNHTAHYDISKESVIGYRGAKIKIISHDSQSITYYVIETFTSEILGHFD